MKPQGHERLARMILPKREKGEGWNNRRVRSERDGEFVGAVCFGPALADSSDAKRRAAFQKCWDAAFDKELRDFLREVGAECGSCDALKEKAAHDCARFLTKEELK